MRTVTAGLLLLSALLVAGAAPGAEREPMAVLDIKDRAGIQPATLGLLNEILLGAFQDSGRFDALGSSDIATMMSLEEQRVQITGCADDACLAEIGGALGVSVLAAASVGLIGSQFVLTLKVIDTENARVRARAVETVPRREEELIGAVRRAVDRVLGGPAPSAPSAATPSPDAAASAPPAAPPADWVVLDVSAPSAATAPGAADAGVASAGRVWPWVALGVTVAAAGTGGVLGGLALADRSAAEGEVRRTQPWEDLKARGEAKALAADVLFGVAGAAAVATLVLFLVNGDDEEVSR